MHFLMQVLSNQLVMAENIRAASGIKTQDLFDTFDIYICKENHKMRRIKCI